MSNIFYLAYSLEMPPPNSFFPIKLSRDFILAFASDVNGPFPNMRSPPLINARMIKLGGLRRFLPTLGQSGNMVPNSYIIPLRWQCCNLAINGHGLLLLLMVSITLPFVLFHSLRRLDWMPTWNKISEEGVQERFFRSNEERNCH